MYTVHKHEISHNVSQKNGKIMDIHKKTPTGSQTGVMRHTKVAALTQLGFALSPASQIQL